MFPLFKIQERPKAKNMRFCFFVLLLYKYRQLENDFEIDRQKEIRKYQKERKEKINYLTKKECNLERLTNSIFFSDAFLGPKSRIAPTANVPWKTPF